MEQVICVDKNDHQIGLMDKIAAHQRGVLHRAFSIFVFKFLNEQLFVLLQRRAFTKYHTAGLWSNTCCSHAKLGLENDVAALKRLKEEMGFECVLTEVGIFTYNCLLSKGLIENEIDHVFVGLVDGCNIQPNPVEVDSWKWVEFSSLKSNLEASPSEYTPWLPQALSIATEGISKKLSLSYNF